MTRFFRALAAQRDGAPNWVRLTLVTAFVVWWSYHYDYGFDLKALLLAVVIALTIRSLRRP